MGCHGSKQTPREGNKPKRKFWLSLLARLRKNNKVLPLNVPATSENAVIKVRSPAVPPCRENAAQTDVGTPMLFLPRQPENIVLEQLKEEGIISDSKSTGGGVAFTIKIKVEKQATKPENKMPFTDVPKYSKEESVLMSQIVAEERLVKKLPRILPPLPKASKVITDDLEGYTPEERQIMAEVWRNDELQSKGKMARLSMERKEMAAERRKMKEMEKKANLEKKMVAKVQKSESEKVKVADKLKRAKIKREALQLDLKVRTEQKLSKSSSKDKTIKVTMEEKFERARLNREKRDADRREKWLQKERKLEAIKIQKEEKMKKSEGCPSSAHGSVETQSEVGSVGGGVKVKEKV